MSEGFWYVMLWAMGAGAVGGFVSAGAMAIFAEIVIRWENRKSRKGIL